MSTIAVALMMFCNYNQNSDYRNRCIRELTACMFCLSGGKPEEGDLLLCSNYESDGPGSWEAHITNPEYIKRCGIHKVKP